jgi:formiminoglutamate deiminase
MTATYWCEQAWVGDRVRAGVTLSLTGGLITTVSYAPEPPAGAHALRGLTLPGLANVHSHTFQRALRGHTQVGTGSFWTWREQMYALATKVDPDQIHALARATFAEMLLAGVTTVGEFHYVHHAPDGSPYSNPNETGHAIIAAASEAGIRLTLLDTCYLEGGIARFRDRDATAWSERVAGLRESEQLRIGAAIHSIRAVDPTAAAQVAEFTGRRPLHAHVSEQPGENQECLARYGATPATLLPVSATFTAVHATHLTDGDIQRLGGAGANVCLCPTTERDLADGIGPARRLRDAGARLAVGSDSHAVIDLFEEARAIELDERLATGVRGHHTAAGLISAATTNGHACLGWPDGGLITEGALADLVTVATDSVRTAGTPADAIVFSASAADVREVIVAGRQVVAGGRHLSIDVPAELRAAIGNALGTVSG